MGARHVPEPALVERFQGDLDPLIPAGATLGLAVSGGADSLALLLLAAAARPGLVHVATVDHRLRAGSAAEAQQVAALCEALGVPHRTLAAEWPAPPTTAVQEKARAERYRLLAGWAREEALGAIATGHHLDDQAETLAMRLARGAGVRGLAGMRPSADMPGAADVRLIRPLLRWRRAELEQLCAEAGVSPASDPSNADPSFERVRIRDQLREATWFDAAAAARSARFLADADAALEWATDKAWSRLVEAGDGELVARCESLPAEIQRRVVARAVRHLATEGEGEELRGRELDQLLAALRSGARSTLRGVLCIGGSEWRFIAAPNRTRRDDNLG